MEEGEFYFGIQEQKKYIPSAKYCPAKLCTAGVFMNTVIERLYKKFSCIRAL
ncbi:MAG: hypothetical protein HYV32_06030 [Candidatus Kerfeldbacteria bacterium]|nr:hypothetical protein [Candidatus Kerfeldbacteria bacterium]